MRYALWIAGFAVFFLLRLSQVHSWTGKLFYSLDGQYLVLKAAVITGEAVGISRNEAVGMYHDRWMDKDNIFEANKEGKKWAYKVFRTHPFIFIKQQLLTLTYILTAVGRTQIGDVMGQQPTRHIDYDLVRRPWRWFGIIGDMIRHSKESQILVSMFVLVHLLIAYLLAVRGLLRDRPKWVWVVITMYGYLLFMSTLTDVNIRFRVPLMPGLLILAGLGVKK